MILVQSPANRVEKLMIDAWIGCIYVSYATIIIMSVCVCVSVCMYGVK